MATGLTGDASAATRGLAGRYGLSATQPRLWRDRRRGRRWCGGAGGSATATAVNGGTGGGAVSSTIVPTGTGGSDGTGGAGTGGGGGGAITNTQANPGGAANGSPGVGGVGGDGALDGVRHTNGGNGGTGGSGGDGGGGFLGHGDGSDGQHSTPGTTGLATAAALAPTPPGGGWATLRLLADRRGRCPVRSYRRRGRGTDRRVWPPGPQPDGRVAWRPAVLPASLCHPLASWHSQGRRPGRGHYQWAAPPIPLG